MSGVKECKFVVITQSLDNQSWSKIDWCNFQRSKATNKPNGNIYRLNSLEKLCLCKKFILFNGKPWSAWSNSDTCVNHLYVWFPFIKWSVFSASNQCYSKYEGSFHYGPASRRASYLKSDHKKLWKRNWSTISIFFSRTNFV